MFCDAEDDASSDAKLAGPCRASAHTEWPVDPTVWCVLIGDARLPDPVCVNEDDYEVGCIADYDSPQSLVLFGFCQLEYVAVPICDVTEERHFELRPPLQACVIYPGSSHDCCHYSSSCDATKTLD